jgi:hypothetical protein
MEHQIENRRSAVKGYGNAFAHIEGEFFGLVDPCEREAEAKYDTKDSVDRYANELHEQIMADAMELIFSRTD